MPKKVLLAIMLVAVAFMFMGCATIFYSHRAGLPPESRTGVDVLMLVLDVFFFFPVSIIVDLVTGCIYTYSSY